MKTEHNPGRYSELSRPRPADEIDASIAAFTKEVLEARIRHKLADVHMVIRVVIDRDGDDAAAFSTAHLGAVQEAEGMCAYALAAAVESRSQFVNFNAKAGFNRTAQDGGK